MSQKEPQQEQFSRCSRAKIVHIEIIKFFQMVISWPVDFILSLSRQCTFHERNGPVISYEKSSHLKDEIFEIVSEE